MANIHFNTDETFPPACMCRGREFRLLANYQSLLLSLGETSAQGRGFRCMNCGLATCFDCSDNGKRCACKDNAWVALPYLERATELQAYTGSERGKEKVHHD